jgi:hypothetical protein
MRLQLGSPVHCTDAAFGELGDVVDPVRRRVTHLVVEPHHRHRLARLVPIDLARPGGTPGEIALSCTAEEVRRLPHVDEVAYIRFGELPLDDPDWDVGIETVLAQPYYDYPGFGRSPMDIDPHVAMTFDRVPRGEVEIRRASDVLSADGHRLGHVDGLLVDVDDRITHVVLERGHLFGQREVTVPIAAVGRVATDSVMLDLTKDEVGGLPAVPVHRWIALRTNGDRRKAATTGS